MLIRAALELGLDLSASWMVGDMMSDILAGINARCQGCILVQTGKGLSEAEIALDVDYLIAADLLVAAELILTPTSPRPVSDGANIALLETSHTLCEPR